MAEEPKQEGRKVRAIVLWAASYTGATWISLVLGSHKQVFSLGNIRRALEGLRDNLDRMCVVHRENCTFWPVFAKQWEPRKNLLAQIREFTGCEYIVVNNPRLRSGRSVINDKDLELIQFAVQRDLRALAASYMRKNPGIGIEQTIQDYLLIAADTIETDVSRKNIIVIDHGIASENHNYLLEKLRLGTGLEYNTDNLRFWEHNYHVVSSNAGTIGTIRAYQNMTDAHRQEYYDDFVNRIRENENENADVSFYDRRWKDELTRYDLFVIDQCVGKINKKLGYERDIFESSETGQFSQQLEKRLSESGLEKLSRHLQTQGSLNAKLMRTARLRLRTWAEKFC